MADGLRVEVLGADSLARTLGVAAHELDDMSDANHAAGALLVRDAAGRAPRRTGRLAGSIRVTEAGKSGVTIRAGAPYGPFQEFGTRYVRATYFLTGTLAHDEGPVVDVYAASVDHALGQVRGQ
jgi:HK97 gp10 family phage protein